MSTSYSLVVPFAAVLRADLAPAVSRRGSVAARLEHDLNLHINTQNATGVLGAACVRPRWLIAVNCTAAASAAGLLIL